MPQDKPSPAGHRRNSLAAIFGVLLILVLTGLAVWWVTRSVLADHSAVNSATTAPDAPAEPAKPAPIRVGVLFSHYTATGPTWIGEPYGYEHAMIADQLHGPGVELFAIVEPGTQDDPTLNRRLRRHRITPGALIDSEDPRALAGLDVIVAFRVANMTDETIKAISLAVQEGVGLLNQASSGLVHPGITEETLPLHGLVEGDYFWLPQTIICDVVGDHPLLGGLKGTISIHHMNGTIGTLRDGDVGLIAAQEIPNRFRGRASGRLADPPTTQPSSTVFYPLRISQWGKGRILLCQWYDLIPPSDLQRAHDRKFYLHCVEWLAKTKDAGL